MNTTIYPNGKYIFTGDGEPIQLLPDSGKMKYVVSGVNQSTLDVYMSFLDGLVIVNFKYMTEAALTHRYSVRQEWAVLQEENDANYVIRYFTDIQNGNEFFTDSNGLEKIKRVYGNIVKTVDENFYPLTRFIYIQDANKRLAVLVDRAQGGSSTKPGVLEVMVNRRSTTDDYKGAGETAFEPFPISTLHYLTFDFLSPGRDNLNYRRHQLESDHPLIIYRIYPYDGMNPLNLSKTF